MEPTISTEYIIKFVREHPDDMSQLKEWYDSYRDLDWTSICKNIHVCPVANKDGKGFDRFSAIDQSIIEEYAKSLQVKAILSRDPFETRILFVSGVHFIAEYEIYTQDGKAEEVLRTQIKKLYSVDESTEYLNRFGMADCAVKIFGNDIFASV